MENETCKCGSPPSHPTPVKGSKNGFVIRCSNPECPATVQRMGKIECIKAWNEMATKLF